MKSDVMQSVVRMEQEVLDRLVAEVKETIATDVCVDRSAKRSFGAVDLWNIERKRKYAGNYLRFR
jgi:hypothetical protein